MKKKNYLKLLVSLLVVFTVIFGVVNNPLAKVISMFSTEADGHVTISVEKFTLGQGYIVEPITVSYKAGETVAELLTKVLGEGNYENTGSVDSAFYLSYIRDEDEGEVNVPQYILDQCGSVSERSSSEWLGEFDYTSMSGWMYCVNNAFPNYGASDCKLEDGQVIRWQFTVYGYGMDIGGGYSDEGSGSFGGSYIKIANKDELTKAIGNINADKKVDQLLSKKEVKKAYDNAYTVLETADASQEDVDKALNDLNNALENKDDDKKIPAIEPSVSVQDAVKSTGDYLYNNTPNPTLGTFSGEWTILSLARSGYNVSDNYYETYYKNIEDKLNECGGVLSTSKYTEYSRLIIGLTSIGKDVTNVSGYNLLSYLSDFDKIKKQGINGPIFALIALDTKNYEIPISSTATTQTTRQGLIDYILSKEIKTGTDEAGGWALGGTNADPDITSMALQALAKYKDDEKVKPYIDRAVQKLSDMQNEEGGYSSWGTTNSESIAQVITALTALGIDPKTDERFVKNGNWTVSAIMNYYVNGGGFKHVQSETAPNGMATDQAMYALVAYNRFVNGQTSLYNMTDIQNKDDKDNFEGKVKLTMPEKISGKAGYSFNVNLNIGSWPQGSFKLLDGVITIPDGIEITGISMNNSNISGGTPDFGVEGNTLRIVYGNTTLSDINILNNDFPNELLTINARVKNDLPEDSELNFKVDNLELKKGSDESDISSWDTSEALSSSKVAKVVKASARVLFNGDGIDLIPLNKKAVADEFINIEGTPKIIFGDNTEMTYNEELTNKKGVKTYVALVDSTVELEDFNDISKYLIDSSLEVSSMKFGDVNDDNIVNAQDALNTLSTWLRKSSAPEGIKVIKMNVTGDSRINTSDALGIMEYYVNGKEFSILNN